MNMMLMMMNSNTFNVFRYVTKELSLTINILHYFITVAYRRAGTRSAA